eukprot:scaffold641_cov490-Prasinococcus_capsulatus_cf.AAC.5
MMTAVARVLERLRAVLCLQRGYLYPRPNLYCSATQRGALPRGSKPILDSHCLGFFLPSQAPRNFWRKLGLHLQRRDAARARLSLARYFGAAGGSSLIPSRRQLSRQRFGCFTCDTGARARRARASLGRLLIQFVKGRRPSPTPDSRVRSKRSAAHGRIVPTRGAATTLHTTAWQQRRVSRNIRRCSSSPGHSERAGGHHRRQNIARATPRGSNFCSRSAWPTPRVMVSNETLQQRRALRILDGGAAARRRTRLAIPAPLGCGRRGGGGARGGHERPRARSLASDPSRGEQPRRRLPRGACLTPRANAGSRVPPATRRRGHAGAPNSETDDPASRQWAPRARQKRSPGARPAPLEGGSRRAVEGGRATGSGAIGSAAGQ